MDDLTIEYSFDLTWAIMSLSYFIDMLSMGVCSTRRLVDLCRKYVSVV